MTSVTNGQKLCTRKVVFQTVGSKPHGKLVVGLDACLEAGKELSGFTTKGKVLLLTDSNVAKLGLHERVVGSLIKEGFQPEVLAEIESEPHIETVVRVAEIVRSEKYCAVVGLGGGSVLDVAKMASLAATNLGSILDYMTSKNAFAEEGIPKVLIPTTSGTGSEVSSYMVFSSAGKKLFLETPYAFADIALVDPLLSATMPPRVTAYTGLDALAHAVESMISLNSHPITEAAALKSVDYVFRYLRMAVSDKDNLEARYYMCWASVLGMMAYSKVGGLYAHSISYILTTRYNTPHGIGCGVALPYTLAFNFETIEPKLRSLKPFIGLPLESETIKVPEAFFGLVREVGIPNSLKDLGVPESDIEEIAQDLVKNYYRQANPRAMNLDDARALVSWMWSGKP